MVDAGPGHVESDGIAAERTVIAGFSQGGILSASVALTAPESVRGFAVLAGRILPELEPMLASRERLAGIEGLIAHGHDDDNLPVSWAQRADAWLTQLGVAHDLRLYPGGHGIGMAMAADFVHWADALLSPGQAPARLRFDADGTWLVGGSAGLDGLKIAPGIASLLHDHFKLRIDSVRRCRQVAGDSMWVSFPAVFPQEFSCFFSLLLLNSLLRSSWR